uniref:RxLR effector protein n=1 Tax=Proboscia inermis TaxID=420281 RepID=A0A7S0GEB5_9STRA
MMTVKNVFAVAFISAILLCSTATAFVGISSKKTAPSVINARQSTHSLNANVSEKYDSAVFDPMVSTQKRNVAPSLALAISAAIMTSPLLAIAEEMEDDNYEYGAVNAPGGLAIAVVGGVLAVLSALLPLVLQGGEDAFEEMKASDKKTWGKGTADPLKGKKRR